MVCLLSILENILLPPTSLSKHFNIISNKNRPNSSFIVFQTLALHRRTYILSSSNIFFKKREIWSSVRSSSPMPIRGWAWHNVDNLRQAPLLSFYSSFILELHLSSKKKYERFHPIASPGGHCLFRSNDISIEDDC